MVAAGVLLSGGSLNTLMASIVSSSMGQGILKKNIDSLKATFKERMSKVSKVSVGLYCMLVELWCLSTFMQAIDEYFESS